MSDSPVSAPAAPAAPPASPAQVSPPHSAAPAAPSENAYAELEALDAADKAPPPKREKKTAAESVRGADGKFQSQPAPSTPKPKEEGSGTKPVSGESKEGAPPLRTAELRARYDETKAKLADLEPKLAQYERELTELRSKAPDTKPFEERLSTLQKENESLKEEIRFVNYRKHPEFTEKYQKPYEEAWGKAVAEVSQLTLTMQDGTTRKATANDFLALANAPLDQLDDLAQEWFPKSAARVIRHVEKVRDLAEAQETALAEARKGAGEREKQQTEQQKRQSEAVASAYLQSSKEITEKYPKWFAPEEGDIAGNDLLKKGFEYADSVLTGNGALTAEQKAKRLAVIRAKAANHDRLAARLRTREERIKELEADLAKYEASEPSSDKGGQPGGTAGPDYINNAFREIEALDKKQ